MTLKNYLSKRQKDEGIQTLKESLKEPLTDRFLNHGKLNIQEEKNFCNATALDPRFKFFFFDNPNKVKKWIISEMSNDAEVETENIQKTENANLRQETHEDVWACFSEIITRQNAISENEVIEVPQCERKNNIELEKYIQEPLIKRCENPIQWWKNHIAEYPKFRQLVLKYLSAPPSSASSEQMFSSAKQI